MNATDTSAEAVERLAAQHVGTADMDPTGGRAHWHRDTAATLIALLRERDELAADIAAALRTITAETEARARAEAVIAGEDRISDSEMMALLRRRVRHVEAERDAARAEAARLMEALKPFAAAADDLDDPPWRDDSHCWESPAAMAVTAGDFRRARAAWDAQSAILLQYLNGDRA